jgi:hypothetical protein
MDRAYSTHGKGRRRRKKKKNTYMILVGKSEGKRPLEVPRHRWKVILKLILEK